MKASEQAAWILDGDRGITYSAELPEGSRLAEGEWYQYRVRTYDDLLGYHSHFSEVKVARVKTLNETIESILAFARERLGRHKVPRSIDVHDELPRQPNGKLYLRTLRDPYWAGHERSI